MAMAGKITENKSSRRIAAADGPAAVRAAARRRRRIGSPHGLRIAAIDIGTNSLHMVVVEVTEQLGFRVLSSEKEMTQLGASALVRHVLPRSAMNHTLGVLGRYAHIARNLACDRILAYATSAVRESVNGGDFVEAAKARLGMDVHVINSQEEARLIYLAVRQGLAIEDHPVLIVDIGGGSAEFIVATAQRPLLLESRKTGASRLSQEFVHSDPISKSDLRTLRKHLNKILSPICSRALALKAGRIIGTSGTMENLAAMCIAQHGAEVSRRRVLTFMTQDDFASVYRRLLRSTLKERRRLPGLDPDRAPQIVAGAALVDYLFQSLKVPLIEVSDRAMREGMIIDYMQTHWPKVRLSVEVRNPRRRSIIELGRRCNYDEKHARQVATLAVELFDQLQPLHRLGAAWREILEHAAMMHDIGWHIGHTGHHKHSYYLVKNGDLEGFSLLELDLIANIARYHRRAMPKRSHADYMSLDTSDQRIVSQLAAILRIAEALDRGHYGNIRAIKTVLRRDSVRFIVYYTDDPELELWAAQRKAEMFEQIYARKAIFTARSTRKPRPNKESIHDQSDSNSAL